MVGKKVSVEKTNAVNEIFTVRVKIVDKVITTMSAYYKKSNLLNNPSFSAYLGETEDGKPIIFRPDDIVSF